MNLVALLRPVQATDPTSTMATVSGTSASPLECPSKPVPVKILRDLTETSSRSMEKVLGQNLEEQERALVAEHLTRLDHTRVDAWDVVENLCLEQLGSQLELSTPMEGKEYVCLI